MVHDKLLLYWYLHTERITSLNQNTLADSAQNVIRNPRFQIDGTKILGPNGIPGIDIFLLYV